MNKPPSPVDQTLGVLGGMGPAATAEFMRQLALAVPVRTDQEHPRVIVLSQPSIPERTSALLAGDDAPLAPLRAGLLTLAGWGADLLAVPCNTAHAYIDRIRAELPVPLVHIVDSTLDRAEREHPDGAWLAASTGTVTSGLYQRAAADRGYPLLIPDPTNQALIHRSSVLVKASELAAAAADLREAYQALRSRRDVGVLAACTELPMAYDATGLPAWLCVSSLAALAEACAARLGYASNREGVRVG